MPIGRFFRRAKWDRERLEEIESYVRIETDENIARGMPAVEARTAARRKFGNSTLVREEIYSMNTIAFLDTLRAPCGIPCACCATIRRSPPSPC
jgi:hypothetical protein